MAENPYHLGKQCGICVYSVCTDKEVLIKSQKEWTFIKTLGLIRKYAYNILRIAMLSGTCESNMTEAMDTFCDDLSLIEKYVFNGIESFY